MIDDSGSRFIASRILDSPEGTVTLEITATREAPESGSAEASVFTYRLLSANSEVIDTMRMYGEDDVQALIHCLAAAGDYLRRFLPSATWLESGGSGLLHTDESASPWRATT